MYELLNERLNKAMEDEFRKKVRLINAKSERKLGTEEDYEYLESLLVQVILPDQILGKV